MNSDVKRLDEGKNDVRTRQQADIAIKVDDLRHLPSALQQL